MARDRMRRVLLLAFLGVIAPVASGMDETWPPEKAPTIPEILYITEYERNALERRFMEGELTPRDLALLALGRGLEAEIEEWGAHNQEVTNNLRWCIWLDEVRHFDPKNGWTASDAKDGAFFKAVEEALTRLTQWPLRHHGDTDMRGLRVFAKNAEEALRLPSSSMTPAVENLHHTLQPTDGMSRMYAEAHLVRHAALGEPFSWQKPHPWEKVFSPPPTQQEWLRERGRQMDKENEGRRDMTGSMARVLSASATAKKATGDGMDSGTALHIVSEFAMSQRGNSLFRPTGDVHSLNITSRIARHPSIDDMYYAAGEAAFEDGRVALATLAWERLPVTFPGTPNAWKQMAEAAADAGDMKTATIWRERLIETFPHLVKAWNVDWCLQDLQMPPDRESVELPEPVHIDVF